MTPAPVSLSVSGTIERHELSIVSLYFAPDDYEQLQPHIDDVQTFLTNVKLVNDEQEDKWIADGSDSVIAEVVVPRDASKPFAVRPVARASAPYGPLTDISGAPMFTVPFTREDLLSIALSGKRSQGLLKRLWALHTLGITGANFDDETSLQIIGEVEDPLRNAGGWSHGVLLEVMFPQSDLQAVESLLEQLYDGLKVFAVVHGGDTLLASKKPRGGSVIAVSALTTGDDERSLIVEALAEGPVRLHLSEIDGIVEPFLRGICLTTTQIAVIRGLGTDAAKAALEAIVATARDNAHAICAAELVEIMERDLQKL